MTPHNLLVDSALDLLGKCLHWDPTVRISARDALYHPFLALPGLDEGGEGEDDELVPHPFGQGVCGSLHFRDEMTDDLCVFVPLSANVDMGVGVGWEAGNATPVTKTLVSGEGIAIGGAPCEFHVDVVPGGGATDRGVGMSGLRVGIGSLVEVPP